MLSSIETKVKDRTPGGPLTALLSALLFGVTTPLTKTFLQHSNPLLIAGLLYLGGGVGLWLCRRGARPVGLARADWPWLATATLFGGIVAPALLMFGLRLSDASTASLLLNLEAVFTALLAWFVFHEATGRRVVLGFIAIFSGSAILAWPSAVSGPERTAGLICIAGACLCWGIDNNLTRKIIASDSGAVAAFKGVIAGTTNTALALAVGATMPAGRVLAGVLILGFFGYGVSLVLFIVSLRRLGIARTSAYFSTAPFIGSAVAVVLFGQPLTVPFYIAGALMAFGVWLHVSEQHEHEHEHEFQIHTHPHLHDLHHQHAHSEGYPGAEPHTHEHQHASLRHHHPHFPDIHHEHRHG